LGHKSFLPEVPMGKLRGIVRNDSCRNSNSSEQVVEDSLLLFPLDEIKFG